MKKFSYKVNAMQISMAVLIMVFCIPTEANAQFWKKWFRKKKKEPVVTVVDTVPTVPEVINTDTVANAVFVMPETEKSDSLSPFGNYITDRVNDKLITINGVEFKMKCVQGGTFIMGKTVDQFGLSEIDEYPPHRVAISTFMIGETEVTQALWKAVMGTTPSNFKNPSYPVESVSWNDCQSFIAKLNSITGLNFRLPTEAEWEYAARGGNVSGQWHVAGDDDAENVAWIAFNSTSPNIVATKKPNELGLYDMSGNIAEWCHDWYGEYSEGYQTNPVGPEYGDNKVVRGGHWIDGRNSTRVAYRFSLKPSHSNYNTGLRLVLNITDNDIQEYKDNPQPSGRYFQPYNTEYLANETFKINNTEFTMVGVQGGTFYMGATLEQVKLGDVDEQPCHNVAISSFRIGQTEVTQGLWKAVMGNNPSKFNGDNLPVENVTWDECQAFIKKLNSITGLNFRLPTEAEWEYAARGGNISCQYTYPGSDNALGVAWNAHTCTSTMPVARLEPNELGIYDMGGNVAEWCEDWYSSYSMIDQTNPAGPGLAYNKVIRGSFWEDGMRYCRCSYRDSKSLKFKSYNIGFRLAL